MNILLVDDTDDMRKLVELFLKMLSHTVESAGHGKEALDAIQGGGSFDVVLMDMRMPVMDGYEATSAIRAWEKEQGRTPLPIIALTSFSTQEEISKSLQAGCNSHLVKPVNKEALDRALKNLPRAEDEAPAQGLQQEDKIEAKINPDLEDLITGYMDKRRRDVEKFRQNLESGDLEEVRSMGHKVKGSGGGYGFHGLSQIGAQIESAAKEGKADLLKELVDRYEDYLNRVVIIYED